MAVDDNCISYTPSASIHYKESSADTKNDPEGLHKVVMKISRPAPAM